MFQRSFLKAAQSSHCAQEAPPPSHAPSPTGWSPEDTAPAPTWTVTAGSAWHGHRRPSLSPEASAVLPNPPVPHPWGGEALPHVQTSPTTSPTGLFCFFFFPLKMSPFIPSQLLQKFNYHNKLVLFCCLTNISHEGDLGFVLVGDRKACSSWEQSTRAQSPAGQGEVCLCSW